jgi:hypothetical protein
MAEAARIADMTAVATPRWLARAAGWTQNLKRELVDPYRPELHYMRGPGPKWHAKHAASTSRANNTAA